jgi:oxygen-dependent protoporphyrinogen oxidase
LSDYSQWAAFDRESVADWLRPGSLHETLEYLFEPMLHGFYFQTPEETSRALGMVLAAFGLRRARTLTLADGLGCLPEALAAELDVRLGTPVSRITAADDAVTIATPSGPVRSQRAILAVPAPIAKSVVDEPPDPITCRLMETQYSSSILVSLLARDGFALPEGLGDAYGLLIPRTERCRIAAIGIERNKRPGVQATGQLLNVMLRNEEACRMMPLSDETVIAEVVGEASRYFPALAQGVTRIRVFRWPLAEPCSSIGRASDLRRYRELCALRPPRIVLAGDYMSMPYTEGAAESGVWAAQLITDAANRSQPGSE